MSRVILTDRFVNSRKPAPPGGRDEYRDAVVPGLALRVTDQGHRSYVLVARYPANPKNPTRRALGTPGSLTLNEARERARNWLAIIGRGEDPRFAEAEQKAAAKARMAATFERVAQQYIEEKVYGPSFVTLEAKAKALKIETANLSLATARRRIAQDPANAELLVRSKREGLAKKVPMADMLRQEFISRWKDRLLTDIKPQEVADAIKTIVRRGTPYQAHTAYALIRGLFSWAAGTGEFGTVPSPVAPLKPTKLIGEKIARARTLKPAEIQAIWEAAGGGLGGVAGAVRDCVPTAAALNYPFGPIVRLLLLTGQRLREVAHMRWSEVDFEKEVWIIPPERMKGRRTHEVPLAPIALALLKSISYQAGGNYVFSTMEGKKPVSGFGKIKGRLDSISGTSGWQFHDLRRTVRTHLSALPVEDLVRELVIAHAKPGLHRVYDQHAYRDEKRQALTLWEKRLCNILEPKIQTDTIFQNEARGLDHG